MTNDERLAEKLRDLGAGVRASKDNGIAKGNTYGDIELIVSLAKQRHRPGVNILVDKAMAAVEGSLSPVAVAHAKRAASGVEVPALERVIVPNQREHLLIVIELAEGNGKQEPEIHGQAGPDVAA